MLEVIFFIVLTNFLNIQSNEYHCHFHTHTATFPAPLLFLVSWCSFFPQDKFLFCFPVPCILVLSSSLAPPLLSHSLSHVLHVYVHEVFINFSLDSSYERMYTVFLSLTYVLTYLMTYWSANTVISFLTAEENSTVYNAPHFLHPPACWWASKLVPLPSCCE